MNFVDNDDDLFESQRKEQLVKKQKKLDKQARLDRKKNLIEEIKSSYHKPAESNFEQINYKKGSLEWALYILNAKSTSDLTEIKKNYLQLAQQYHPDKNKGADKKQEMQTLNEAWELLKIQFR